MFRSAFGSHDLFPDLKDLVHLNVINLNKIRNIFEFIKKETLKKNYKCTIIFLKNLKKKTFKSRHYFRVSQNIFGSRIKSVTGSNTSSLDPDPVNSISDYKYWFVQVQPTGLSPLHSGEEEINRVQGIMRY